MKGEPSPSAGFRETTQKILAFSINETSAGSQRDEKVSAQPTQDSKKSGGKVEMVKRRIEAGEWKTNEGEKYSKYGNLHL